MIETYTRRISNHTKVKVSFNNTETPKDAAEIDAKGFHHFNWEPRVPHSTDDRTARTKHFIFSFELKDPDRKFVYYVWQNKLGGKGYVRAWSGRRQDIRADQEAMTGHSKIGGAKEFVIHANGDLIIRDYSEIRIGETTQIPGLPTKIERDTYVTYVTNQQGLALARTVGPRDVFETERRSRNVLLGIDLASHGPPIFGFGAAFTDSAIHNLESMRGTVRDEILEAYFGATGLGYTMGRVPIGSSDFTPGGPYAYVHPKEENFELKGFELNRWDHVKIPYIRKAQELVSRQGRELRLFASPWTAPPWMKSNEDWWAYGTLKKEARYHQTWAEYFSRFLDEYKKKGIDFWGVTVQNEPRAARFLWWGVKWEAMNYTAEEQLRFVKNYLGPTLRRHHPNVKIMVHDDQKTDLLESVKTLLGDPEAHPYIDGVAFHWYQMIKRLEWCDGDPWCGRQLTLARQWLNENGLNRVFLLPSEACEGFFGRTGPQTDASTKWYRAEQYGHDIISDLNNSSVGWMDWNLTLDTQGGPNHAGNNCDALILCDPRTQTIERQPLYYYFGHFTKFIVPGSYRLVPNQWEEPARLESAFFKRPDGIYIAIVQNATDDDLELSIQVKGKYLNTTTQKHSIRTFAFPEPS